MHNEIVWCEAWLMTSANCTLCDMTFALTLNMMLQIIQIVCTLCPSSVCTAQTNSASAHL